LVYVFEHIRKDITTNYKPLTMSFNTFINNYLNIKNNQITHIIIQNLSFNIYSNTKN